MVIPFRLFIETLAIGDGAEVFVDEACPAGVCFEQGQALQKGSLGFSQLPCALLAIAQPTEQTAAQYSRCAGGQGGHCLVEPCQAVKCPPFGLEEECQTLDGAFEQGPRLLLHPPLPCGAELLQSGGDGLQGGRQIGSVEERFLGG